MELPLLPDIVIILGLSVLIVLIFQRLKIPVILGFLITGMIVGPHGFHLIKAVHEVEILSEIGVIFLLFVIGIEFSLKGLTSIKSTVLFGGSLQVGGTILLVTIASYILGLSLQSAIFMGFLLSLSSTAIVFKMLQEKGELTAPYGRVSVAILIFQDIGVVLMMLIVPLLAGEMEDPGMSVLILLIKVFAILVAVFFMARFIVPTLYGWVVRTKSQELFILTTVVLCFATAWLTSAAGLSLALGAFFAGLIISESDYSHQANANILPFREIFISFFFVSVGMLLDISFYLENILFIHLIASGVILLKMFVIGLSVYLLRYHARTILLTSLAIFQVGEFAFVLSSAGMEYELLSERLYQYFLAISIISMGATPLIINFAPSIAKFIIRFPVPTKMRAKLSSFANKKLEAANEGVSKLVDHLIIIGYGVNGENVARAARKTDIPFVVVDLDPLKIQKAKSKQENAVFGDATNEQILRHVQIQKARIAVIAISDPEATLQIVKSIRTYTETIYIVVRTRYLREVEEIIKLGADEVVPEEFETSIEIFGRVMKKYLVPNDEIRSYINDIRSRNYEMLRTYSDIEQTIDKPNLHISDMDIATLPVYQGKNEIVGKTIGESGIRSKFNVSILAIKRGDEYITDVTVDTFVEQDDILYIFGTVEDIAKLNKLCVLE